MSNDQQQQCRVCLEFNENYEDLFQGETPICQKLILCAGFEISQEDFFYPTHICNTCLSELEIAYRFRRKCEAAELRLRNGESYQRGNDPHESISQFSTYNEVAEISGSLDVNEVNDSTDYDGDKYRKPKNCKYPVTSQDHRKKVKKRRDPKHMCPTCGKLFQSPNLLEMHRRVHTGEKPFTCETCSRSFARMGHLTDHQRVHTGVKPYKCHSCSRAFTTGITLKRHMRTHTGERPYACKICGKAFATTFHLSDHLKRHVDDREVKCDWQDCRLGFINVSEMKRHRMRHEKEVKPSEIF